MFNEDDIEWRYCVTRDESGRVTDLSRARIIEWENPNAWEWFWDGDWADACQVYWRGERTEVDNLISTRSHSQTVADTVNHYRHSACVSVLSALDMADRYFRIFWGEGLTTVSIRYDVEVHILGPVSPEFRDEIEGAARGIEYRLSVQTFDLESGEWDREDDDTPETQTYSQSAIEKTLAEDYPLTEFPIELVLPEFQS